MIDNSNKYIEHLHPNAFDIEHDAYSKVEIGAMVKECIRIIMRLNSKMSQSVYVARQEKCNYRKFKHHLNHWTVYLLVHIQF